MPLARRANTDPVLYYQTQDKWVREYWVHVEYMKLLKDEVRNCYRREGVNHYENCRDLVQEYYKRTKAPSALRPRALAHARIPPLRSLPAPRPGRELGIGAALARLGRSLTDAGCRPQCTSSSESGCVARVARSIIDGATWVSSLPSQQLEDRRMAQPCRDSAGGFAASEARAQPGSQASVRACPRPPLAPPPPEQRRHHIGSVIARRIVQRPSDVPANTHSPSSQAQNLGIYPDFLSKQRSKTAKAWIFLVSTFVPNFGKRVNARKA